MVSLPLKHLLSSSPFSFSFSSPPRRSGPSLKFAVLAAFLILSLFSGSTLAAESTTSPSPSPSSIPALAQAEPTSTPAPASKTSSDDSDPTKTDEMIIVPVPSVRRDNGLGPDGALGVDGDGSIAGGTGKARGGTPINTGGIIGLAVGLFVLIVISAIIWYIWWVAKKRQMTFRQSARHSARRLTNSIRPSTRGRGDGSDRRGGTSGGRSGGITSPRGAVMKDSRSRAVEKPKPAAADKSQSSFDKDLEKSASRT